MYKAVDRSPRTASRTSPSHKFEPSIWSISTTMRIQWILRVEWRLVNTSPEDDKRGQLITSLRSRPKSFTDQSGGAVKVVETGRGTGSGGRGVGDGGQTEVAKGGRGWRGGGVGKSVFDID